MEMKTLIAQIVDAAVRTAYPGVDAGINYEALLEVPPDSKLGDFAFPCFKLSKALRMGPPMIAQKLAAAIDRPEVCTAQPVNGYLNFFLNRGNFAKDTLQKVMAAPERWGSGNEGEGKTVVLDYSSINIAKRFHIGHLSTTMIGNSLCRIYGFLGWHTVSVNHLGDWGTQFGKMICAYKKWGNKEEVEKGGVDAMTALYVRFHEEAEKNPELENEGRAWFKKIEDGDPEALEIFNWFKDVTLKDASRVYDKLGVQFDYYTGESFYHDKTDRVVNELKEKGLLTESDGAQVVDLSDDNMPPCLILKSDGTTIYATRDLAAIFYRKDTFHFDKCLYVVAYQQDLHFRQWFKVVEKMGYEWAKDLVHVAFGMISYEGQSLSTRKGHVVFLEDLLLNAIQKARAIIEEKSPDLDNKDEVARQVGIGAVIYADLQNNRIKDIDFSWERALSFDGETGPYVQYTHARCCSALRKAEGLPPAEPDYAALSDDFAQELLRQLSRFPETVREAAARYEPSIVTRAVTELCKAYNKFYYENRILEEDAGVREARVRLTRAVRDTIRTGLWLIGMEAPERM